MEVTRIYHPTMPDAPIRVRCAIPDDLPRIMEIARQAFAAAQWGPRQYEQLLSTGRMVLVIEEQGQVAGFIAGQRVADEWDIENIAVVGPSRRKGLGSRLLSEFLHHARSSGAGAVFLEVRESNQAARKLYEKWGFSEAGRRKSYYVEPLEDALVLKFIFPEEGEIG